MLTRISFCSVEFSLGSLDVFDLSELQLSGLIGDLKFTFGVFEVEVAVTGGHLVTVFDSGIEFN